MEKLKKLRKEKNYALNDMAKLLNISKTFYWQLESEKRRLSYDMAIKITDIFSLKPDDLFYDVFKDKRSK